MLFSLVGVITLMMALMPTQQVHAEFIDRYDPTLLVLIAVPEKSDLSSTEPISGKSQADIKPKAQPSTFGDCQAKSAADFEQSMFDLINQERQKAGVPLLTLNENLNSAARQHSADMSCEGHFSHVGSSGSTPFDRIKEQGYVFSAAGENIFAGDGTFFTPEQALKAWLNSSSHRATMLREHYSEVGIGVVYTPGSQYGGYFTIDFASPAP
jgi:uncharacterized protein YkwD